MKHIAFILLCLLIAPASPQAAEPAAQTYEALVAAAKEGKTPVDWTAIRLAYTKSKNYDFLGATFSRDQIEMTKALDAKDYATATKHANLILDGFYGSMFAHRGLSIVYGAASNKKLEQKYHDNYRGIMKSVMNGGDGMSREHPFLAVTVSEEYVMLDMIGLQPLRQTLVADDPDGHTYHVVDAVNANGGGFEIFFQIDEIAAAEAARVKKTSAVEKE